MKTIPVFYTFLGINCLFWAIGILLLSHLAWFNFGLSQIGTQEIVVVLLVFGVLSFTTGFIGCCGGVRINLSCLNGFVVIVVLCLVFDVALGLFFLVFGVPRIGDIGTGEFWLKLSEHVRYNIQKENNCCGMTGANDFLGSDVSPDMSCYYSSVDGDLTYFTSKEEGCKYFVVDPIKSKIVVYAVLVPIIVIAQIVGLVMACFLIKKLKKQRIREQMIERKNEEKIIAREKKREEIRRRKAKQVEGDNGNDGDKDEGKGGEKRSEHLEREPSAGSIGSRETGVDHGQAARSPGQVSGGHGNIDASQLIPGTHDWSVVDEGEHTRVDDEDANAEQIYSAETDSDATGYDAHASPLAESVLETTSDISNDRVRAVEGDAADDADTDSVTSAMDPADTTDSPNIDLTTTVDDVVDGQQSMPVSDDDAADTEV